MSTAVPGSTKRVPAWSGDGAQTTPASCVYLTASCSGCSDACGSKRKRWHRASTSKRGQGDTGSNPSSGTCASYGRPPFSSAGGFSSAAAHPYLKERRLDCRQPQGPPQGVSLSHVQGPAHLSPPPCDCICVLFPKIHPISSIPEESYLTETTKSFPARLMPTKLQNCPRTPPGVILHIT